MSDKLLFGMILGIVGRFFKFIGGLEWIWVDVCWILVSKMLMLFVVDGFFCNDKDR